MGSRIKLIEGYVIHRDSVTIPKKKESKVKPRGRGKGRNKKTNRSLPFCKIMVYKGEIDLVREAWRKSGLSAREVFYRGLGLKPPKRKLSGGINGIMKHYRKENGL